LYFKEAKPVATSDDYFLDVGSTPTISTNFKNTPVKMGVFLDLEIRNGIIEE